MTDSMKFGPEWLANRLRNNSGSTLTLSTPRYQLAEHRYGREEMLALFDRNYKPPEPLTTFSTLYVEKTQLPLALIQMTEDETRMWNGGVTNIGSRGRGGSVDRGGRGRSGRGSLYSSHYSRAVGFDDSGEVIRVDSGQSFQARSRPFDRSQSERGWSERNGSTDSTEWNGSTSPRKELARGVSGSSLMESNWRRHRSGADDEDGWRKWGRNSWREGGSIDRDRLDRNEGDGEENRNSGGRWEFRGSHRSSHDTNHLPPPRTARTWESNYPDNHDNLPEWATENPSESGGRFDASGAFHGGMYSDDDEEGIIGVGNSQESRTRRVSEGNASGISKSNNKPVSYGTSPRQIENRHINNSTSTINRERSKSVRLLEDKDNIEERETRSSPSKAALTTSNNISTKSLSATSSSTSHTMSLTNVNTNSTESEKTQANETDKCSNAIHDRGTIKAEVKTDVVVPTTNRQVPGAESQKVTHDSGVNNVRQRSEDDLDRMKEEADALVAKLMADEESHKEKTVTIPPPMSNQQNSSNVQEKWFYRDPQGEVQGPFLASEMAEWCKAGYFTAGLMVRRACDERYTTLGELMKICGRVPFIPGPSIPPLKLSEPVIPPVPSTVPAGMTAAALPKPGIEDPLLLLQYQHMRLLQNQQILLRQMRTSAIAKLSQSEHWTTLSPVEQNQLILQYVIQDSEIPDIPISTNPFVPHLTPPPSNPVMQLFNQMQQAKAQTETHLPPSSQTNTTTHPGQMDPIQQLIQQMGGIQNVPTIPQTNLNSASTQEDNPIKSLLRQLNVNATGHPQASHIDTVWPHPPPQIAPQFNAQNWLTQVGSIPAVPPGQLPTLWNLHTKEMKTEQQILEEQNLKMQEQRKKEELRKQEELQRQAEEERVKRKQEEEQARQAEEAKRKDEERKKKEEEKKRKEEEKRKQEEEQKRKEEKKRKEEEKKKKEEEKKKQEEENIKKKQEEEKRKREEIKKQEEKQKKEEEKKKKLEEEQRKQEEERLKKEAEARKLVEAEEQARRAEQRRREAEALRKLQERSKAPWAQTPHTPTPTTHASLAEIQRLEREKKAEEQRYQQLMQQQLAQQKAVEAAQEAAATDSSKRLQFKWAEKATSSNKPLQVKSLAQIQQEEQERITKQQEKERLEKVGQKESASVLPNAGIWGTASQCLNWTNSSTSSNSQAWSTNTNTSGFWDDSTTIRPSFTTKQTTKPATTKSTPSQQPQQQQQQQQNNKSTKTKGKKEEELVKKLFEQNTAKPDDFTQWCNKALSGIQASVDIPTFVGFLRDIESPYEVKEYVRVYLGDSKQSTEFAKQFLEKRSKWRSAQRPQAQVDNLCKPAPAVNPNASTEFQEVKGKSKKPKKGKMFKVDNRILGFSVTAAPDRINVGDRDYGEGV